MNYTGKRVIITGAASGMGEATAKIVGELGATIYALDIKSVSAPVEAAIETNLADPESIDAAVKQIGGPVHALFNCAGVPGPPFSKLDTMLINFVGPRYLTEAVIPLMTEGGAIASISSLAGMGYLQNMRNVMGLLAARTFDDARAWCESHPKEANGYAFAKECLIVYAMMSAKRLAPMGIRINSVSPGITETPMLPAFYEMVGKEWMHEHMQGFLGRNSKPDEQAWPLAFLNSDRASFISGTNLYVDAGYAGALMTGQVKPPPAPTRKAK